jgi:hypothetical protein
MLTQQHLFNLKKHIPSFLIQSEKIKGFNIFFYELKAGRHPTRKIWNCL